MINSIEANGLEIFTAVESGAAEVAVRGSLVTRTVGRVDAHLQELHRLDVREVRVDLHGLTRLDSSGVAFLLRVRLRAPESGWEVHMTAPPEHLQRTISRLGVAARLPFAAAAD